ncbi:OpgC domain-containing protein [Agrobacterium rubi]|nr:OpgC domain-containing protein [Agrobacterium rubi]NTF24744.1 OpgC domain-containing protein [Agrobacterium rubi]
MSSVMGRDMRLDLLRGFALVTIFVNHVPGNVLEHFTSRNFGFFDAAEAFVLMSGIAAGLAYSRGILTGTFLTGSLRIWARVFKLYTVHIAITLAAIVILMCGLRFFGETTVFRNVNAGAVLADPVSALVGVFSLGHQLGYFNILPLYVVLLTGTPFMIRVAGLSLGFLLGGSALLWFIAGMTHLNMPNWPTPGGWFLNPFSWQLVYVIGLLSGLSAKRGAPLVPRDSMLFWSAVAFLVYSLFVVRSGYWSLATHEAVPAFIGAFDKTYLSLQRLLHVLALAYVVANLEFVSHLARSAAVAPLNYLGRNSLSVFAAGSVVCVLVQVVTSLGPEGPSLRS